MQPPPTSHTGAPEYETPDGYVPRPADPIEPTEKQIALVHRLAFAALNNQDLRYEVYGRGRQLKIRPMGQAGRAEAA
jgi:hypothetical protein